MHLARFPLKVHKHHAEGDDQQEGGAEDGLFRPEAHGQIAENGADGEAEDGEEVKSALAGKFRVFGAQKFTQVLGGGARHGSVGYLDMMPEGQKMPYITHGFLRADSRNSMGFILLYGKKNVSRYGFRHSVLEATRRPVCHVILQRCAGRDMLDDAAAEAQLAEADELLTAVGFVQYLPRRWAKPGCEDKFWQGAAAGMDVLAFGLCACTKLDGMETTNTGDLSVYLAHSADYEQITVSTVPAEKTE